MSRTQDKQPLLDASTVSDHADSARQSLIERLQKYISRIESYRTCHQDINFSQGFWFDKKARAISRKANYYFARELLQKLQQNKQDSIQSIFQNPEQQRKEAARTWAVADEVHYKEERGIGSRELNGVIKHAMKMRG